MLLSCKKWFKHFHPLLAVASGQDLMDELTPGGELTLNLCAFNGCPVRKRRKCTADGLSSDLSGWLAERNLMQGLIREHLLRAQQRMKAQEDTKRSDRQFKVGDWAFLKLQPYVQQSVV